MIIYKDFISGNTVFSDSFKMQEEEDFLIHIDSKVKKFVIGGETFDTGANASAEGEDADEGDETAAVHQFEFVHLNELEAVEGIDTKSQLKDYLKKFVKNLSTKIKADKGQDVCTKFQQEVGAKLKLFLGKYSANSELFSAKEFFYDDFDHSLIILNRAEDGLSGTFTAVKAFVEEEKC